MASWFETFGFAELLTMRVKVMVKLTDSDGRAG